MCGSTGPEKHVFFAIFLEAATEFQDELVPSEYLLHPLNVWPPMTLKTIETMDLL